MVWRMSLHDVAIARLDGTASTLGEITGGKTALLVNVASQCGLTPQYEQLETVQRKFAEQEFTVVGVPCNQFGSQEPGTPAEIAEFAGSQYHASFPLTEKIEVNGEHRHALYEGLVSTPDETGKTGDIAWNFEKFVIDRAGKPVARFNPMVTPDDPLVLDAIRANLG